jgi:DNA repair exonuclease SbcCD ATPase subunit
MPCRVLGLVVAISCLFPLATGVRAQPKANPAAESLQRAMGTLRVDLNELHGALDKLEAAYARWAAAHDEDEAAEEALDSAHADRDVAQAAVSLDEESIELERAARDENERKEIVQQITGRFGFSAKDIETLQRQGRSLSDIIVAGNLAMSAEKSVEDVLKLKDEHQGWAGVARELGLESDALSDALNLDKLPKPPPLRSGPKGTGV